MLIKIIKNGIVDDVVIQKYLLPNGLLQDSIQQSLDMVVTDGFFNNAAVRRELDQKYPTLMKKPNPVNVIFKDKAHFDVQNSIIGLLAVQVSNNEKAIFEQIKKAPSAKDVTISETLEKLKKFNKKNNNDDDDNDDDNDGNGNLLRLPTLPSFPPKNNEFDGEFDSQDEKLTPIQKFLLDKPQKEKLGVAVGENQAFVPQPQEKTTAKKVKFSDDLAKIFPEGNEIVKSNKIPNINEKDEILISNAQEIIAELNRGGKLPDQSKFFEGDSSEKYLVLQNMRKKYW